MFASLDNPQLSFQLNEIAWTGNSIHNSFLFHTINFLQTILK